MWLIAIYQMLFSVVNWSTSMGQEIVEEIEMQGFKIMTLQERYGDEVKQWVYLDESVLGYDDLRYLSVLHFGFDGYIYEGESAPAKCPVCAHPQGFFIKFDESSFEGK